MERINVWQRRDRAPVLLLVLLLLGMGAAFWVGRSAGLARVRSQRLHQLCERVRADFGRMDGALRGGLLDSRLKAEADRHKQAAEDLIGALDDLESEGARLPELLRVVHGLRDFVRDEHGRLHAQVWDRLEAERAKAQELYLQTAAAVGATRDRHLQALERQVQTAQFALGRQADLAPVWAGVVALLVLVAAGLLVHRQSVAAKRSATALATALDRLAAGDLSAQTGQMQDEAFDAPAAALGRLVEAWTGLLGRAREAGTTARAAADEAATAVRQQEGLATETSSAVAELSAAAEQMTGRVGEWGAALNDVTGLVTGAARQAAERQTDLRQAETALENLHQTAGRTSARLATCNEHLAGINSVIATITKVADQTNLLSLNAAIEAEKAGEYGLGFAVVAMEIRRLADQTAVAAGELEKMVKELQAALTTGVLSVEKLAEELRRSSEWVRQTGAQWSGLVRQVEGLPGRCQALAAGAQQQGAAAQRVGAAVAHLGRAADQMLALLRQAEAALERVTEGLHQLQDRLTGQPSARR